MTLGTVIRNKPHLCTVFYVSNDQRTLYFKSRTESAHSRQFMKDSSAAVAIYSPGSNYSAKAGVQTQGVVRRVKSIKEMTLQLAYMENLSRVRRKSLLRYLN